MAHSLSDPKILWQLVTDVLTDGDVARFKKKLQSYVDSGGDIFVKRSGLTVVNEVCDAMQHTGSLAAENRARPGRPTIKQLADVLLELLDYGAYSGREADLTVIEYTKHIGAKRLVLAGKLIEAGAMPNPYDTNELTALQAAIAASDPEMVRYLITSGADLGHVGFMDQSPLADAMVVADKLKTVDANQVVAILKEYGAPLILPEGAQELEQQDSTPEMHQARGVKSLAGFMTRIADGHEKDGTAKALDLLKTKKPEPKKPGGGGKGGGNDGMFRA